MFTCLHQKCITAVINLLRGSSVHFENAERGFSNDDMNALINIIKYCQKHQIKLVFFSAPMPDFRVLDTGLAFIKYRNRLKDGFM